ncbi:hypothetical protein M406DRAFT_68919 [Cryphonectria parasitica EP155]|uniref:Uncharacterized protein n=1 Tax=Cryphonectria parasitica (strain ATCC 38755 / EP155) TaxID=660469 RepID=A0A9P4Y521_CRYP1|nr:uncharacterized protein M406DRAFT_68919 [Cryphonectria parasitica EP155]KAF3766604.1 hypothetical protein M406DRAFT_68919 [Cryphonectria parasitica EP155]
MAFRSALLAAIYMATSACAETVDQGTLLYSFGSTTDIENAVLRPNGQILMVPLSTNTVYNLDPSAATPSPVVVATLPGVDSVQGIASIGDDKYAVTAGVRGDIYVNETVFTIDLANGNGTVTPETILVVPEAENFNGLVSLPSDPNVLLVADSVLGLIWRIDLEAKTAVQVISDELMALSTDSPTGVDLGIDGLKLYIDEATGELYVYFTNVSKLFLARMPILANGTAATGAAEIVANQTGTDNWDDMAIAQNSSLIFGAMNPTYIQMVNITSGEVAIVANFTTTEGPTSVVLADDGVHGYSFTRDGDVYEVTLPNYA